MKYIRLFYVVLLVTLCLYGPFGSTLAYAADLSAEYHNTSGDDSAAVCTACKQAIVLSDSLSSKDCLAGNEEIFGMETLKAEMQTQRRQVHIVLMYFVLLFCLVIGVYLYLSLRRERRLKRILARHCETAQECSRMKTDFLNMVGHEIRTPLNVIGGFAEVLASGSIPQSQQGECVAIMLEHSRMLISLMHDMLEVANLDNCSEDLYREPMCAGKLLRDVAEYVEANRREKRILCLLKLPDEEIIVRTNPGYITHVFHELVKNAIKFAGEGTITLSCRIDRAAGVVECAVADTGPGIPEDKSELIFDRFVQLDTFVQGTGLGLYLCRLIMRKIGGSIRVDPSYAGGLCVVVTLPLSEKGL